MNSLIHINNLNNNIEIKLSEQQQLQSLSIISILGSTAAGKSTLTKLLTNNNTMKHSKEQINAITIKMGYSNLKIYKNNHITNNNPDKYILNPNNDILVNNNYQLIKHISIADNPGHNKYILTMLSGTVNSDNTIILVSGTNGIENQTEQHFKCFKYGDMKNLLFLISKMDLVSNNVKLEEIRDDIDNLMNKYNLDENIDPSILPISTFTKLNIDKLIEYLIDSNINHNLNNLNNSNNFDMLCVRSFDINKVGTSFELIKGGIIGGTIIDGYLQKNDLISIFHKNHKYLSRVVELMVDTNKLNVVLCGGFVAIETTLDPSLTRNDNLVGAVIKKGNVDALCTNKFEIIDDDFKFNFNFNSEHNKFIFSYNGQSINGFINYNDNNLIIELDDFIFCYDNIKITIVNYDNNECYEIVSFVNCKGIIDYNNIHNHKFILPDDIDDYLNEYNHLYLNTLPTVSIINDLKDNKDGNNIENNFKYDIDDAINNGLIATSKKKYIVNYPSIELEKSSTSVKLTNIQEILKFFCDKNTIKNQLQNLAKYILEHNIMKDNMKNCSTLIDNYIIFNNLKKTHKSFFVNDFNSIIKEYVNKTFYCNECKVNGSIYIIKNKKICKNCNASK